MDIGEVVAGLRERFAERVKPLIESGDYRDACSEMRDLLAEIRRYQIPIIRDVHAGNYYFYSAKLLFWELLEGKAPSRDVLRQFEAYSAQTKLPLIR